MSKHAAAPAIWYPNQRVIRTVLQNIAAVLVTTAVVVGVVEVAAPQFLDALADVLPPAWYAWGLGAVAFVGTVSGVLAKIMAIPLVNDFLTRFGAGSVPRKELPAADEAKP
jgi:hypothetical protein